MNQTNAWAAHNFTAAPTQTTAQLRTQAREAEARLDWTAAADLWAQARAAYPLMPGRKEHGALALEDIATMKLAEDSCRHMAESCRKETESERLAYMDVCTR